MMTVMVEQSQAFALLKPGFAIHGASQIIEPAAVLFAEKGFDGVTMQELADRAGVAKPTLYSYVQTKHRVLEAVFDHLQGEVEQALAAAKELHGAERLREVVRIFVRSSVQMRPYFAVYFAEQQSLEPEARERMVIRTRGVIATIRDYVVAGQQAGEVDRALDAGVVTFGILSIAQSTGQWLVSDGRLGWEAVADQFCRMIFDGLDLRRRDANAR